MDHSKWPAKQAVMDGRRSRAAGNDILSIAERCGARWRTASAVYSPSFGQRPQPRSPRSLSVRRLRAAARNGRSMNQQLRCGILFLPAVFVSPSPAKDDAMQRDPLFTAWNGIAFPVIGLSLCLVNTPIPGKGNSKIVQHPCNYVFLGHPDFRIGGDVANQLHFVDPDINAYDGEHRKNLGRMIH
nr:hypothetical protein Iba_chr11aCG12250 [Ipomoea batatas]